MTEPRYRFLCGVQTYLLGLTVRHEITPEQATEYMDKAFTATEELYSAVVVSGQVLSFVNSLRHMVDSIEAQDIHDTIEVDGANTSGTLLVRRTLVAYTKIKNPVNMDKCSSIIFDLYQDATGHRSVVFDEAYREFSQVEYVTRPHSRNTLVFKLEVDGKYHFSPLTENFGDSKQD